MIVKVASWNMGYWQYKKYFDESWNYFLNKIDADILFFQEARPPEKIKNDKKYLAWREIGGKRNWGSGIYSKKYPIQEIKYKNSLEGAVIVADLDMGKNGKILLISMYGLFPRDEREMMEDVNLHRMFFDLSDMLNARIKKGGHIILGGDLNNSIQFDEEWGGNNAKIFFDRVRDLGLVDCFKPFYTDYVQTLRHAKSDFPWQNDYFFIDKPLLNFLKNTEVLDNDIISKYSDHNPIVITLDL